MSKRTNFDITDVACLHIVHILQHPASCPTTKSMETKMVKAYKKTFSQLLAGRYRKSTKWSTELCHQGKDGKIGLEADRVWAHGTLPSLRSRKKITAEKQGETYFLSNEEKEQWIEDYVERETAVARMWVEDAEAADQHEREYKKDPYIPGLRNTESETTFD